MLTDQQSYLKSLEATRAFQAPKPGQGTETNESRDQKAHPYPSTHGERRLSTCEVPVPNHM